MEAWHQIIIIMIIFHELTSIFKFQQIDHNSNMIIDLISLY